MQQVFYYPVSLNVLYVPLFKVNFSLGAVETGGEGSIHGPLLLLFQYSQGKMQSERLVYRRESICAQTVLLRVSYRQTIHCKTR
jgi:hypothetical protein